MKVIIESKEDLDKFLKLTNGECENINKDMIAIRHDDYYIIARLEDKYKEGWEFEYIGESLNREPAYKVCRVYGKDYNLEKGDIVGYDELKDIFQDCVCNGIAYNILIPERR